MKNVLLDQNQKNKHCFDSFKMEICGIIEFVNFANKHVHASIYFYRQRKDYITG